MLNNQHQLGVSLIESMISLLVISIGLLGIAALQITAMKQNNSAMHHSQSVWISYDMADRIRANSGQFAAYAGIDTDNAPPQDCTGGCIPALMVGSDAESWASLVQNLPSGRGTITNPPLTNELLIRVMWDDEGTGAIGTGCGTDPTVDLTCFTATMIP